MHFVLPFLFYFIFSSAYGCTEKSNFELDTLLDTKHLESAGQCDDGSTIVLDRLLEQRLSQLMQFGELNMGNLMVKLTAMLKDPNLQSLFDEFNSNNGCTSSAFELDMSDDDGVVQMTSSEVGASCGALN